MWSSQAYGRSSVVSRSMNHTFNLSTLYYLSFLLDWIPFSSGTLVPRRLNRPSRVRGQLQEGRMSLLCRVSAQILTSIGRTNVSHRRVSWTYIWDNGLDSIQDYLCGRFLSIDGQHIVL